MEPSIRLNRRGLSLIGAVTRSPALAHYEGQADGMVGDNSGEVSIGRGLPRFCQKSFVY